MNTRFESGKLIWGATVLFLIWVMVRVFSSVASPFAHLLWLVAIMMLALWIVQKAGKGVAHKLEENVLPHPSDDGVEHSSTHTLVDEEPTQRV